MVKYNIEFLPESYKDLDNIFDYILLDSPREASTVLEKIMTKIERLGQFPLMGKRVIHTSLNYYNFRMIVIYPYIAFYRLTNDTIYIYRILHGASDYIKILDEDLGIG